jgi:uncharacterized peroxidase-related enzyme
MSTVRLWTDAEAEKDSRVKAVFDDIRATRKTGFVNNVWRALANHPDTLERIWAGVKDVMVKPGELDPLVKEMIYIAVSISNGCGYCVHSHTAAAKAKGMTPGQHAELLAVVAMAAQTNSLLQGLQLPVDQPFLVES